MYEARAERELDRFLRSIQAELAELLETVNYEAALKKLTEAKDPAPAWVQAQVRLLNVKALTIQKTVAELSDKLETLLDHYIEAGGADPLRTAHGPTLRFWRRQAQNRTRCKDGSRSCPKASPCCWSKKSKWNLFRPN